MRLRRLKITKSAAGGGLLDGVDIWFGRDRDGRINEPIAPLCLIGPNGSGKSQFLQLLAEVFQAAWNAHNPAVERDSANPDAEFELTYLIRPSKNQELREVALSRLKEGRRLGPIRMRFKGQQEEVPASSAAFGDHLPSLIVGYTSGENETLSLPFLVSRAGYADDVTRAALKGGQEPLDNKLMLVDYGTNLEVLFASLMLGQAESRKAVLDHARLNDIASCRVLVRLAHGSRNKIAAKNAKGSNRKGIQLTAELEAILENLKRCSTCWSEDTATETYKLDFWVNDATRQAFSFFWPNALELYRSLHKLALLNDLAIPKAARDRVKRAVRDRRFAARLPEPQVEEMVFGFEEVRFWPKSGQSEPVDYVSLSDGEHQQALVLGLFGMISGHNAVFLLDEPESHFNPQWRVQFVKRLMDLSSHRGDQDILLTSHAPFVASDMPKSQVLIFRRQDDTITVKPPEIETYGASFDRILEHCFNISPPISQMARDDINDLMKSEDIASLELALGRLAASVEKTFVAERLLKLKGGNR